MRALKCKAISRETVIETVRTLFAGQRDLLLGFNQFLPPSQWIIADAESPVEVEKKEETEETEEVEKEGDAKKAGEEMQRLHARSSRLPPPPPSFPRTAEERGREAIRRNTVRLNVDARSTFKWCMRCLQDLPHSNFALDSIFGGVFGRHSHCNVCTTSVNVYAPLERPSQLASEAPTSNVVVEVVMEEEVEAEVQQSLDHHPRLRSAVHSRLLSPARTAGEKSKEAQWRSRDRRDADGDGATSTWCNQCLEDEELGDYTSNFRGTLPFLSSLPLLPFRPLLPFLPLLPLLPPLPLNSLLALYSQISSVLPQATGSVHRSAESVNKLSIKSGGRG
jgi:hypothetical protein